MSSDRLTLVVFKDHLSSRTLTVRLAWLRAFALALLSVIGLAVIAGSLFLNAYRKTITSGSLGNARKTEELERDLAEMRAAYDSLKEQALKGVTGSGTALGGAAYSFSALPPDSVLESLPARETLPFRMEPMKATWKGSTLHIRSAIEYSREDGGNQQGHFILIVRGPQSLHAYPDGVLAASGSPTLMKPEAGEFFSVSRYREVNADFGPFSRRDEAQSVEVYIFDTRKRLIYSERVGLENAKAAAPEREAAPPPKKVKPKPAVESPPRETAPQEASAPAAAPPTDSGAAPAEAPTAPSEPTDPGVSE